jgi:hypothetical protein
VPSMSMDSISEWSVVVSGNSNIRTPGIGP